ncbi:hypothetical protein [Microbacterium paraoxydans]|uniref:hypothetical protein n=1 Tax=Microbacterium paraoxydans TaxID=199592 RepID=UPI0011A69FFD|nr:hypothetical protein [Microbacterium paraoxydans]
MTFWSDFAWLVGGTVVGLPIGAAMSSLPAPSGTGVSLRVARTNARTVTDWQVWAWFRRILGPSGPKAPSSDDDAWGGLLLSAGLMLLIVRLYVQNVVSIAVILFWTAVLVLLITATVFLVLWWRRVFDGKGAAWALFGTVPFAGVGSLVAYWLIEPPLQGVIEPARAALDVDGVGGLFPYLIPLILQILGAASSFILLVSSMAFCGANVAAALIESRAWGSRWLWRFVFWTGRWTTGRWVMTGFIVLAVLALFSASGLAAEWIANVQDSITPAVPIP